MHEQLGGQGVKVYALNVPAFGETALTLEAFKQQAGLTYPVMDHQGTVGKLNFPGDNTFPYPRDAIVDQTGRVVFASNVYDSKAIWGLVENLLENPPE